MPVLKIGEETLEQLQMLASTTGSSVEQMIHALVNEAAQRSQHGRDQTKEATKSPLGLLNIEGMHSLLFTRPLKAVVGSRIMLNPSWSSILVALIKQKPDFGPDDLKILEQLHIPAALGLTSNKGYRYYPELDLSIQGRSAYDTWLKTSRLAHTWRIPVTVQFQWTQHPKAQHPGRVGALKSAAGADPAQV